ncbi:MAG: hypothetical protein ACMUEM_07940 [Flavobacteriales bacterium AspAUS03]
MIKKTTTYILFYESFFHKTKPILEGGSTNPTRGINYEIGIKREWVDGKWMIALLNFKILKSNLLTSAGPKNPGLIYM